MTRHLFATLLLALLACSIAPETEAQPILVGRWCCTNAGSCAMPSYGPVGTPCTCAGPWGLDHGRICQ